MLDEERPVGDSDVSRSIMVGNPKNRYVCNFEVGLYWYSIHEDIVIYFQMGRQVVQHYHV